jgi:trimeric autotransporter adhesin
MNPLIQCKITILPLLIAGVLACLGLSPKADAVVPAPDGGYPGFNTAEGQNALLHLTTGTGNTAVGWVSLESVTTGSFNTGVGAGTLVLNSGDQNTATGAGALLSNTTGGENTATGAFALFSNTAGIFNTANGYSALYFNTADNNTATGYAALYKNTIGIGNTANGYRALFSNTGGFANTANGYQALHSNTTGSFNTANGIDALYSNTTGIGNTANGYRALGNNTAGGNTALGYNAGFNLITGFGNVCIGADVLGVVGESDTTRIRNIYASVANGRVVYVNSDNKIGTLASSRRFKEEIKPMEKASEVLFALKPVSFRYKKEFDAGRAPMFGLIAEDVEQVDPDLVSRNEKGEVETVRYEQINAMLLNEFLKEHRTVQELKSTQEKQQAMIALQRKDFEATTAQQQKEIQALTASLKEQAAQIQKVSTRLEASKFATGRIRRGGPESRLANH